AEVLIKHPEQPLKTKADYRNLIIQALFNQMLAERYSELTRQSNPPFVQASASIGTFIGGTSIFDLGIDANPGELERGFKAAWREAEKLKRFGFTQTELGRAKQSYLNDVESALKEKNKTQSEVYVKEYLSYFLKGIAAPGIETEYRLTKNDLPGITLADLNNLAKSYITDKDRDVLVLAPNKDKTILPDKVTVNKWITAVDQENLQPYK